MHGLVISRRNVLELQGFCNRQQHVNVGSRYRRVATHRLAMLSGTISAVTGRLFDYTLNRNTVISNHRLKTILDMNSFESQLRCDANEFIGI